MGCCWLNAFVPTFDSAVLTSCTALTAFIRNLFFLLSCLGEAHDASMYRLRATTIWHVHGGRRFEHLEVAHRVCSCATAECGSRLVDKQWIYTGYVYVRYSQTRHSCTDQEMRMQMLLFGTLSQNQGPRWFTFTTYMFLFFISSNFREDSY